MKPLALLSLTALLLGACSSPSIETTPLPLPDSLVEAATPSREAPPNWHLLDYATDSVAGISVLRAERELLAGRAPARTVVVAVIDGGVDTAHVDLRGNLWRNTDEIQGNRIDDDTNGYVDDVYGWNFIGGADGRPVRYDTFEITRLYRRCEGARPMGAADTLPTAVRPQCREIVGTFEQKRAEAQQTLANVRGIDAALTPALPLLRTAAGTDSLTVANVRAIRSTDRNVQRARELFLQLADDGITPAILQDAKDAYESQVRYGYDPTFEPRPTVGDDYLDLTERIYGNSDVTGPDADHGTHVAGIIGAVRNDVGVDGVARGIQIMTIRAVPDGDERDKDVANAIRYAVDNGAHIINMSFGKAYSPYKPAVDAAVRYADERGVLMVHAAGNDASDLGRATSFPTPVYVDGGRAQNWIEVGASSWRGLDSLAAPFSNFGQTQVDVFAPGVDIRSTIPGNGYDVNSGTSMAAPVVTGIAAMLMSYFPTLTAQDVKRIILESATRYPTQIVVRPGATAGETIAFGTLSTTGGIVNAYEAVRLAERQARAQ